MTGAEADDSEALRARVAGWLADAWNAANATGPHDVSSPDEWMCEAEAVIPDVLAYGREQATRTAEQARIQAIRDALKALDGHNFHDTAHDRVRRLLACEECGHLPEQHEDDGRGACKARVGPMPHLDYCECVEWETP